MMREGLRWKWWTRSSASTIWHWTIYWRHNTERAGSTTSLHILKGLWKWKDKTGHSAGENGTYFTGCPGCSSDNKRNRRMFTGSTRTKCISRRQSGSRASKTILTLWGKPCCSLLTAEAECWNPPVLLSEISATSCNTSWTSIGSDCVTFKSPSMWTPSVSAIQSIKNAVEVPACGAECQWYHHQNGQHSPAEKEVRERRLPSADVIYAIVKGRVANCQYCLPWLSLRIGEVAGLQFCDIDPVQMRLYVRREIVKVDSGWAEIDHCKTVKSMRCQSAGVHLCTDTASAHQSGTDHIVPFTPNTIRKRFKIAGGTRIGRDPFHDLRHIFASTTAMLNIQRNMPWRWRYWMVRTCTRRPLTVSNKADSVIDGYFNGIQNLRICEAFGIEGKVCL